MIVVDADGFIWWSLSQVIQLDEYLETQTQNTTLKHKSIVCSCVECVCIVCRIFDIAAHGDK